jgi:HJR/Mrr/RecB family endonuclease
MASSRPVLIRTEHTLPFRDLDHHAFERLCLALVRREGYERAEHLGASGGEQGRDVQAWKNGRRWVFQCKKVESFTAADACKEIGKLRSLKVSEQPHELVTRRPAISGP